jgi:hypothetical protein
MMTKAELEAEKQSRLTQFHEIFDRALEPFGRHAPAPVTDEGINAYRRRGIAAIIPFLDKSSDWYNYPSASLEQLKSDALNVVQRDVINDATYCARNPRLLAETAAARPDSLDPDIKVVTTFENGIKNTRYYGQSFVKNMSRPGRRVAGFYTPRVISQRMEQ